MVAYIESGRHQKRAFAETSFRGSRPPIEGAHMPGRLQSGAVEQFGHPLGEGEEGECRRSRGVDDKPGGSSSGRGGRAGGLESRSREGRLRESEPSPKRQKEEEGEGRREERPGSVKETQPQEERLKARSEEERQQRSGRDPRRQRFGSRAKPSKEGDETCKKADEETKKEGQLLQHWELGQGQERVRLVFLSDGGQRHLRGDKDGKENLVEMPGSLDRDFIVVGSGTTPEHPGADLGHQPPRTSTSFPSILQDPLGCTNATSNATGGLTHLLLSGPGPARPSAGAFGCSGTTPQGVRGPDGREALDSDLPVRTGSGGVGHCSYGGGDGACCPRSPRGRSPADRCNPGLRQQSRCRSRRRLEERGEQRQGRQELRKRQGLAKGRQGRLQGHQGEQGWRERQGQGSWQMRRQQDGGGDTSPVQKGSDFAGASAAPEALHVGQPMGVGPPSPGGQTPDVCKRELGAKSPFCFTSNTVPAEERKIGPSQEYSPVGPCVDTTKPVSDSCRDLEGKDLVAMGDILSSILDEFHVKGFMHSKSQSSGLVPSCIFPLPLSSEILGSSPYGSLARATCQALNLLYGESDGGKKMRPSGARDRALKFILQCVETVGSWNEVFPRLSFDTFFKSKGVDYRGEEVRLAQRITWETISPAMPPEVGGVSLLDFCSLGTRHYVENFSNYLVPPEKRFLGRPPLVMVDDSDWASVCEGLLAR